ncbi:hypothetical protein SAMN04488136_11186 [Vibrio xiamenensis]|uniref:Uncharacterized protein n=1 Tax=Vibrio xiamenensis TaxID=861298 RepID=A0A1G8AR90_9VIBR|nr:hypothetical protein [Vibrio xiamenensis]SDH23488.1 hypothetical protein SAMN04488136_11186 [Vibrio xiamenensis]
MKRLLITILTLTIATMTFFIGLIFILPLSLIAILSGRAAFSSAIRSRPRARDRVIEGEYCDVTENKNVPQAHTQKRT